MATRTQEVLGEKGRRIRELTSVVQKRFNFPEHSVELYAEKVATRGLCAIAQAESLRYKLIGGLAVRRACYGVLRFIMESGAKGEALCFCLFRCGSVCCARITKLLHRLCEQLIETRFSDNNFFVKYLLKLLLFIHNAQHAFKSRDLKLSLKAASSNTVTRGYYLLSTYYFL